MINGINISGLSEFANEIKDAPEEALVKYGVNLNWESGTKSTVSTKTMELGNHRSIRSFEIKIDEPQALLGLNSAPNPQEYLFAGIAGCMSVVFLAGASLMNIKIENLQIDIDGELDLTGFLHEEYEAAHPGFKSLEYTIRVKGSGSTEQYQQLLQRIQKHSPNYASMAYPVEMIPNLIVEK